MFPVFAEVNSEVFISFPSGQVFRYSYDNNPYEIRPVEVGELGGKKDFQSYLDEVPNGRLVYSFMNQLVISGFDGDERVAFSTNIPANQSDYPEDSLFPTRGGATIGRSLIWFSDPDDPTAFWGNRRVAIGSNKDITAMYNSGNTFYAFTQTEVFAGAYADSVASVVSMPRIVNGVGCVSQRTIVEGRGMVAFLGNDGVYALSGQSVQKISTDLDDMFSEDGWGLGPMYKMSQDVMGDIPYPFKVIQSQLKFACGGYDHVRNLMWWSVPVTGTHYDEFYSGNVNHGYDPTLEDGTDEMPARVCIVFDPASSAWNIWGSTDSTSFIPTCFDQSVDNGRPRFLFGDEFSGVNAYGEDATDRLSTDGGGRQFEDGTSFRWFWQSHPMEVGDDVVASARTLRVRQEARGGSLSAAQKTSWHLETEISFDQTDGELSFTNTMSPNPSEMYPKEKTPTHIWGYGSNWGTVKFHKGATWRARYNVDNNIVGRSFNVGFSGTALQNRALRERIYDFDIEVQAKRDIT